MTRTKANLVLLLAGAIWGMGFVAQSTAMENVGPFQFVGFRFVAATIAMLPFALLEAKRAERKVTRKEWGSFGFVGLLLFLSLLAQQIGLLTTTVTNSGFLTGLYVVMTPFIVVLLFGQWPHFVVWPAAFCAFIGIWLLSGGELSQLTVGDWLTVAGALFAALQMVFVGRYAAPSGRPVTLAVAQFGVCAVCGLALAFMFEPIEWSQVLLALPEILYAGIFSGGVAFTLQAIGQRYTSSPQAAIFMSSEAIFAALFAALFLAERIGLMGIGGCAMIFAAIIAIEIVPVLRPKRLKT